MQPLLSQKKGQAPTKIISGTAIGLLVLVFIFFAVLFGVATLNPSSFFTTGSADANATANLQANLTQGASDFGQRIPTVLTVLGVVLALAAIVLLILFVRRMDSAGGGGGSSL